MTKAPVNHFKARLKAGEVQLGLWMSIPSPVTAEALSLLGYDWLMFDSEHAAIEIAGMQPLFQAAAAGDSAIVARPAWNDKVLIKKMLDIGAQTLLLPFVQSVAEAEAAVQATRYPPEGIRGVAGATRASRFGLAPGYHQGANEQICTLVQIETREAFDSIEAIAAVDGIDGIFIGPSDLSASLGHLGNPGAATVQEALKAAPERILAAGSVPGILATSAEAAAEYLSWGYRFVAVSADIGILIRGARETLAAVRNAVAGR